MTHVRQVNRDRRIIPTIICRDGCVLVEPSNAELADRLGLHTKAKWRFYDVIVVDGGGAGLTAFIHTTREGLDTPVIERAVLGDKAGVTHVLDNFPGFDASIAGEEFTRRLTNEARRFGSELLEA